MQTDKKNKEIYISMAALIGIILIIFFAATLTPGKIFQGKVTLPWTGNCSSLVLKSIPSPVKSGQAAIIIAQTSPEDWAGTLRFSASEGIISDSSGNEGSIIETYEKIISFSGGEGGNIITVQGAGDGNESCLATITVEKSQLKTCESLHISSAPSPLPSNQSAQITVTTVPADFTGEMVIRADSGTLQSASPEDNAKGENSHIMVTSGKTFYYSGGKAGEKIHVDILGKNNSSCKDELEIKAH